MTSGPDEEFRIGGTAVNTVLTRLFGLVHAGDGEALELALGALGEEALHEVHP